MDKISGRQELFKVDKRGHVRVPKERREALLDEFERCGVSAAGFAAHIGVKYSTFAHWRQVRERQGEGRDVALSPATPTDAVKWVEAIVEESGCNGGRGKTANTAVWIALPGGAKLELLESSQVLLAAGLLRALETNEHVGC